MPAESAMMFAKPTAFHVEQAKRWHDAQALPPYFPGLAMLGPGWRAIAVESGGETVALGAIRPVVEAFLWADGLRGRRERVVAMAAILGALPEAAREFSARSASVWLPPLVENAVSPILRKAGWAKSGWPVYSREW